MHTLVSQMGLDAKQRERKRYSTVGKELKALLEVHLGALASRTDRNGKVLERSAAWRELVYMWAGVV